MEQRLVDANKFAALLEKLANTESIKPECRPAYHAVYLMLTAEPEKYAPTAYDVEQVKRELEELAAENGNCYLDSADVLEIVEGGGLTHE